MASPCGACILSCHSNRNGRGCRRIRTGNAGSVRQQPLGCTWTIGHPGGFRRTGVRRASRRAGARSHCRTRSLAGAIARPDRRQQSLLARVRGAAGRSSDHLVHRIGWRLMDALSETLRVVHLVGAIFINARFTAPWCYQSPSADSAAPLLEPGAERVVIFHLITEGERYVEIGEDAPVRLTAGDVVIFPKGHAHRMTSQPGLAPASGARLDQVLSRRPRQLVYGGGGPTTRLICGYLACDARLAGMLLAGVPALVRVNVRGSNAGVWLEASVRYALAEARSPRPGGAGVLAKLAEVLFIEVLRLYMNEQGEGRTGWLAGVGDRIVGPALNALHARPAHAWTLEELAHTASTSRSVLAERFQRLVGSSPMQYLTQWRMFLAANLLCRTSAPLARIAEDVGYQTDTAFSRAFRREYGSPPAAWRRSRSRPCTLRSAVE